MKLLEDAVGRARRQPAVPALSLLAQTGDSTGHNRVPEGSLLNSAEIIYGDPTGASPKG